MDLLAPDEVNVQKCYWLASIARQHRCGLLKI